MRKLEGDKGELAEMKTGGSQGRDGPVTGREWELKRRGEKEEENGAWKRKAGRPQRELAR